MPSSHPPTHPPTFAHPQVTALNAQLQQLAALVPDPVSAATSALAVGGGGGPTKAISMPPLLAAIMTWVW